MDDLLFLLKDLKHIVEVLECNILLLEIKNLMNSEIETAIEARKIIEETLSNILSEIQKY